MGDGKFTVVVDQIGEDFRTGELQSLGFHIHYDGQEAAVSFLTVADVSLPLQEPAFRSMLRQLAEALLEAAQSPQDVFLRLPERD